MSRHRKLLECDDDEGEDVKFTINKDYAENYTKWREKEEFQKLKDRYGDDASLHSDSSSELEDENADELNPEIEKGFFKALAALKAKDPKIYDKSAKFYNEKFPENSNVARQKSIHKNKPFLLRDYERHLIVDKHGELSDEESDVEQSQKQDRTYIEEQEELKREFQNIFQNSDDENELLIKREKTAAETQQEEEEYINWLKGKKAELKDKKLEEDVKPLKKLWTSSDLDEGEAFLRDYILNRRYRDDDNGDRIPTYDEIVHDSDENLSEDERTVEKQEKFEHVYNFRFEEPDQEFIKQYPRTMNESLRKKDERRRRKREEVRERKHMEKEQKKEELKRLKALKRKEIQEKLEKLKEITGNEEIGFCDQDLEEDFDPSKHDERMKKLFSDEYYEEGSDSEKPVFPNDDETDDEADWDEFDVTKPHQGRGLNDQSVSRHDNEYEPHCEDPDFNMDCEYNPRQVVKEEIDDMVRRKKHRRQSRFAQALKKKKPLFDPNEKTFEEYFDEYYQLDFEDLIGDLPCRFKYRKVLPNDFGLNMDEILAAEDRELNRWVSLKKACQYRGDDQEKYDFHAYQNKARNTALKQKIFSSIYQQEGFEEAEHGQDGTQDESQESKKKKRRRRRKKKKEASTEAGKSSGDTIQNIPLDESGNDTKSHSKEKGEKNEVAFFEGNSGKVPSSSKNVLKKRKKKERMEEELSERRLSKKRKKEQNVPENSDQGIKLSDERLRAYGINPKKFKNRMKYGKLKEKLPGISLT
ncbi:unnamed protein product [Darwinula stevensoni]|uniref:Protein KRI1 homolog n=1 Tax=Darwinula stevensoni TaxID=69355 RepID=A0A7R8WZM4_9CRUS|nr:unnamed protein product [Darwinula stevensoni]CAG0880718.1 unnamed protein product [Darwinula stevensoni]